MDGWMDGCWVCGLLAGVWTDNQTNTEAGAVDPCVCVCVCMHALIRRTACLLSAVSAGLFHKGSSLALNVTYVSETTGEGERMAACQTGAMARALYTRSLDSQSERGRGCVCV